MSHGYSTGATFVPGGEDSYYMPEVMAPAPQRILSEVPGQIQNNLSHLEQQAGGPIQQYTSSLGQENRNQHKETFPNSQSYHQGPQYGNESGQSQQHPSDRYGAISSAPVFEQPNFSPFPVLRNPAPNVPPTDEQREATLEAAREAVLASNDPEMQLTWAQDALLYVEIAIQNEQRVSTTQPPRSRTPRIEHALREDAMKVVEFLADQHHPKAEFIRGMWLEFGKFGQRIDKKEAFHCYSRASEKGYSRAFYRIGMQFESSNDALKAIKYYQQGADAGDSASCYRLGMMTLLGQHGQPQDYERGLNLIYASAETSDENAPQGAHVFGMLQARQLPQVNIPERFLALDIAGAKVNIEKAAFLGFAKAQLKMASAYELGELGCEFNPALSLHYNALAARQGEPEAEMAISKWFLCGHEELFEKNEEMAFTYAQRAAVSGMATAQFAMGYFYEVGIYVPVNYTTAKEWYSRAASGGNKDADTRIESISRSKTLSRRDHERIAVSRIRRQHGSQSGNLPPVVEATSPTLDMPDPSRISLNARPDAQNRPPSAAPYPLDSGPPWPGLASQGSNFSNPERPTSAFGINPNLRPNSAATTTGPRLDSYGQGNYQQHGWPPAQYNSPGPGLGRGARYPSGPGPGPGPGPVPQGRGQARPPATSPYLGPQNPSNTPPPRPQVDIGYSAPLDIAPPGPRPRPGANDPYSGKPQPPVPGLQQARPYGKPSPAPPPRDNRYYTNRPNAGGQSLASNVQPAKIKPSKPSKAPIASAPVKPTQVSANTKMPGKGPKTFTEMGVAPSKGESECIVM